MFSDICTYSLQWLTTKAIFWFLSTALNKVLEPASQRQRRNMGTTKVLMLLLKCFRMQVWVQTYDSKKGSLKHKGPVQTKHTKNTRLKKKWKITLPISASVGLSCKHIERIGLALVFSNSFSRVFQVLSHIIIVSPLTYSFQAYIFIQKIIHPKIVWWPSVS